MSTHQCVVKWSRHQHPLDDETYSRNHVVVLSGDQAVRTSSSVEFKGDPACADPEQLLTSAVASCHMLTFLAMAEFDGYTVERYEDGAIGYLEKGDAGRVSVTRIELSPRITFTGSKLPDQAMLERLHSKAHKHCFIANSIKTVVTVAVEPVTV